MLHRLDRRLPRELPQFKWVNTELGNSKTLMSDEHKHFRFGKYAGQFLGAFTSRLNRRFDLRALLTDLIGDVATNSHTRERQV